MNYIGKKEVIYILLIILCSVFWFLGADALSDPDLKIFFIYYVFKYGGQFLTLLLIYLIAKGIYKSYKHDKYIKENTVEINKIILKGFIVTKDKKTNVQSYGSGNNSTVGTNHYYRTLVRFEDNSTIYFNDEETYMKYYEGEEVGVLVHTHLDKDGKILKAQYEVAGNYKYYQDIKDEYAKKVGLSYNEINNIKFDGYTIF